MQVMSVEVFIYKILSLGTKYYPSIERIQFTLFEKPNDFKVDKIYIVKY
jgi:hypothetical protein